MSQGFCMQKLFQRRPICVHLLSCGSNIMPFDMIKMFVFVLIFYYCISNLMIFLHLQFLMQGKAGRFSSVFQKYQENAEYFMCACVGKAGHNVQRTPGGLLFRQRWNNLQFVTSSSFLLTVYSDYLTSSRKSISCAAGNVGASELLGFAKSQVKILPNSCRYDFGCLVFQICHFTHN